MALNWINKKIILASKSPRRSQLLREAGFQFEVKTREVREDYPASLPVDEVAVFLARKKAHASKEFLQKGCILLAADSVVILENEIFGKPRDYKEAKNILRALSGKRHRVVTGVCLLSNEKESLISSTSYVTVAPLSEEEIDYYIQNYRPYDKAGAYAVQEWFGLCKVSKIEGLYSNIVGLPVEAVYSALREF